MHFLVLSAERINDMPIAASTPWTQISVSDTVLNKRNQGSLEKWLILGNTSDRLVMAERKEALIFF